MTQEHRIACKLTKPSKNRILPLLVIPFVLLSLSLGGAPEVGGQERQKDYSELLSKAGTSGSARVIVRLDVPFENEGLLSASREVLDQRDRIAKAQRQFLESPARYHAKGVKKFKFIPYVAMEVDATDLMALISDPLVISIDEDVPLPPTLRQSVPLINADDAWALGYSGAGWKVVILDTGVEKTHSFFSGNKVVAEACFSTTSTSSSTLCPNGQPSQTGSGAGVNCPSAVYGCSHGTHVAGIAAGRSATINGVAKDADIIAIQVFSRFAGADCTNYGLPTPCALSYTSDQIEGLEYVYSLRTKYNIASVNMSIGGGQYFDHCDTDPTKAAIDNLRSAGVATVIASGNNGYCDSVSAPACISTAVSVGATTKSDSMASYSNYHPTLLSLLAPGSSIYSSVPGGWGYLSGTSMATPHVAGAWAILKQKSPFASVTDILDALKNTGVFIPNDCSGSGFYPQRRIDVSAALNSLATPTGTLQGTVTDALFPAKPIGNAQITLNPPYTGYADSNGLYQFPDLPVGTYDLTATAYRYTPSTASGVSVIAGSATTQDFALGCNVSFADVPADYWAGDSIKAMYCREITNGCSLDPLRFCPGSSVNRAVMAAFVIRSLRETPSSMPYNAYFDDIADDMFAPYVNRMSELGITGGCGARLFCPYNTVKRAPLAVLIIRALQQTPSAAAYNAYFDDLANDWFAPYVNRMFELGITGGCGTRLFCPDKNVNREQAAVFLVRAF